MDRGEINPFWRSKFSGGKGNYVLNYELSNLPIAIGIGNVLQVVTDRKLQIETAIGSGVLDYYSADVVSQSDYYPFGMLLPNTNIDPSTGLTIIEENDYRYSFQGQEKEDEIKGENNSVNYKYRMHDPRVGRFFARDPLSSSYPYNSPYAFSENRVIDMLELEGREATSTTTINSDGSTTIKITVKIGISSNSSTMSQESFNNIIKKATNILETGLVSNENGVTITTDVQFVQNDPSIPIQVEFVDNQVTWKANTANPVVTDPGTLGATNEIGNTNENRIEVLTRGASESEEDFAARTLAHETGHMLGLAHPDLADARQAADGTLIMVFEISPVNEIESPDNLMRKTGRINEDPSATDLEPEQTQHVANVIDSNGGNTTVDNRPKKKEAHTSGAKKKR